VHKTDLEFLDHECADQASFEEFKTSARLKYNIIFMEDEQPNGEPHPVFKCTKDNSCMAKLSVLEVDGRLFISGIITHTHYEEPPKANVPPKMPETKIGRPPKNPVKLPKKTIDKEAFSLDLFKL
jgi:hypothetical protein